MSQEGFDLGEDVAAAMRAWVSGYCQSARHGACVRLYLADSQVCSCGCHDRTVAP